MAKTKKPAPESISGWILTLPCTRMEAEALDAYADELMALADDPPTITYSECVADDPDQWEMSAYFQEKPAKKIIAALHARVPSAAGHKAKAVPIVDQDWVTISQSGLAPVTAGRFHVRNQPSDAQSPDHINLLIPASRAFGTGQHETTFGALQMLDSLRDRGHRFGNVADVGTGTGVLAFAAAHLWPRAYLLATDIDPAAVDVVAENAAMNGATLGNGPGRLSLAVAAGTNHPEYAARAPFDLIIANILAGPLIALAPALASHVAEGGSLILAGLIQSQADAVLRAYRRCGMRLASRDDQGEWPVLHLRKRRRPGRQRPERWQSGSDGASPGHGSW